MKKRFFKSFAFSLVAVLLITAAPSMLVSAATIKQNETNENIYLGKTYKGNDDKKSLYVSYASVSSNKVLTKDTKVKIGNAKKSKSGKKKVSAKTVAINNPTTEVEVGKSVYNFNVTITTDSGKKCTDKVYYFIDKDTNTAGATVNSKGIVSTKKAGTFVIVAKTAKSKSYKKAGNFTAVSQAITVRVPLKITSVKLVKSNMVSINFNSAIDVNLTNDDVIILGTVNQNREYVKGIALSNDKKSVIVELYSNITTGLTYNVLVKVGDNTLTGSLSYTQGNVARIVATDQVVKAGNPTKIAYTVYDESGVDITDNTIVTFESTTYLNGNKITLSSGQMAYVTVVYTNFATGTQIRSNQFKITGSSSIITSIDKCTIASNGAKVNFSTPSNTISLNDKNKVLYTLITDQFQGQSTGVNGKNVMFESLDPNVVIVDSHSGLITPVAVGTGNVKIIAGSITKVVSIVVTASAYPAGIQAPSSIAGSLTGGINNPTAYISIVDQYGKAMDGQTITLVRYSGTSVSNTKLTGVTSNGGFTFTFTPVSAGTTVYQITSGNLASKFITITVVPADNVETKYSLIGINNLDIAHKYDNTVTKPNIAQISLYTLNAGGYKVKNVTSIATFKITTPNGNAVTITGNEINLDTSGNVIAETVGTYTIVAYMNNVEVARGSFTVTDSSTAPTVTLRSNRITNGNVSKQTIAECLSLPSGYTLVDVKFISSNTSEIASRTTFDGKGFNVSHVTATLYNVSIKISNGSRTYIKDNIGNIVVTE